MSKSALSFLLQSQMPEKCAPSALKILDVQGNTQGAGSSESQCLHEVELRGDYFFWNSVPPRTLLKVKNQCDFILVIHGRLTSTHRVQKKNNLEDFIKWNTHMPFFKNAPWDFMLCNHTSKYTIKNLRGFYKQGSTQPQGVA